MSDKKNVLKLYTIDTGRVSAYEALRTLKLNFGLADIIATLREMSDKETWDEVIEREMGIRKQ